jgi:hypothetical protein
MVGGAVTLGSPPQASIRPAIKRAGVKGNIFGRCRRVIFLAAQRAIFAGFAAEFSAAEFCDARSSCLDVWK